MVVKTFRGLLADGGQDRIRLSTIKGKVGYRITKFEVMQPNANSAMEQVIKIYSDNQATVTTAINFTDNTILGAAILTDNTGSAYQPASAIIFDNKVFNQDIYITNKGHDDTADANYYIELEVIPLDDADAEYTTLKDIRSG